MSIRNNAVAPFLNEKILEANFAAGEGTFLDSAVFKLILGGDAKLPLDRVDEVAGALDCDVRQLFRLALDQFYDEETICLFEQMLGDPVTNEEREWLHVIRSAADGRVAAPGELARRLVRVLADTAS